MEMPTSNEDIVIVESKDYAQVIFDDLKECYTENQPLECSYTINELLKPDGADWIGVYRVGFTSCKDDYVCYLQVNPSEIQNNKGKVVFEAKKLPKDDGEFYQFVYVSNAKQIRGASIPFQFKKTHLSDYIEIEESEAVVIKSKESAINEAITEIKSRCVHLTQANDTYEKLIKENEDLIKMLKEEVSAVKIRCLRLTMENEKLNYALKTKTDDMQTLNETITSLADENNKLQSKFQDLTNENKTLLDSLQNRIDQVAQLKSDLESVKMDQIVNLEKQVDNKVEELTNIKSELKRNESIVNEQAQTIQSILIERDSLNFLIKKLTREKQDLECTQDNLSQELNMSKDKLFAAEQCKEMLRAQLVVVTDELSESNKKLENTLKKVQEVIERENKLECEKAQLIKKLDEIKSEYDLKFEQTNGAYYALRLAHAHLETRLKSNEEKLVKGEKEREIQKKQITQLKNENEELKERIRAGAKEYSKLFEKYRLLKNQQFNTDMNVYHDLNGEMLITRRNNPFGGNAFIKQENQQQDFIRYTHRHSTPSSDGLESDSAIQDKTVSRSARASSTEIENTLLDALLNSSFYGNMLQLNRNPYELKCNNVLNEISDKTNKESPKNQTSASSNNEKEENSQQQQHQQQTNISVDDGLAMSKPTQTKLSSNANENDNVFEQLQKQQQQPKPSKSTLVNQISDLHTGCDICGFIFPTESSTDDLEKHYSLHYGPSCPICNLQFRKGYPQSEFENHVNSHFAN